MPPQMLVQEAIKTIVEGILESKSASAGAATSNAMDTSSTDNLDAILHGLTALLSKNGGGPSEKGPAPPLTKKQKSKKGKGKGKDTEYIAKDMIKKPTGAGRGHSMEAEPPWRSGPEKKKYINKDMNIKDKKDTTNFDPAERIKDKATINHLNQLLSNLQGKGPRPDQVSEQGKGGGKGSKGKMDKGKGKSKTKEKGKYDEKGEKGKMKSKGRGKDQKGKFNEPIWYQATGEGGVW
jgi:hypothetical protein